MDPAAGGCDAVIHPNAPEAARSFSLPLDAFSPPLPEGQYTVRVRVRDARACGTPLSFVVE